MAEAHIANRDAVLKALTNELVGPCAVGEPVDFLRPLSFDTLNEAYAPHFDGATKQEILQRDPPTRRYGIGVLYPMGSGEAPQSEPSSSPAEGAPTSSDV